MCKIRSKLSIKTEKTRAVFVQSSIKDIAAMSLDSHIFEAITQLRSNKKQ